jgi:hypothetical protein
MTSLTQFLLTQISSILKSKLKRFGLKSHLKLPKHCKNNLEKVCRIYIGLFCLKLFGNNFEKLGSAQLREKFDLQNVLKVGKCPTS